MGGIMPNSQRDQAIKRLRRAAIAALHCQRSKSMVKRMAVQLGLPRGVTPLMAMQEAWREFPECERDDQIPSPEEVIARCDAYDRQKEEHESIAAREKP